MAHRFKWLFIRIRGTNLPWLEYEQIAPLNNDPHHDFWQEIHKGEPLWVNSNP